MFLRSAHIRHYKSLDDVRVTFSEPVTVFVGPNAVGKSNLIDCLRFVRDAVSIDLEHAIGKRGGISRVRQYAKTKPFKVSVSLDFRQEFEESAPEEAVYEFTIQTQTGGNYAVERERAACWSEEIWHESDGTRRLGLSDAGFERTSDGKILVSGEHVERPVRPDQLALGSSAFIHTYGEPISDFVKDWRYSAIYPNTLRAPASPDKDTVLAEEGTNWASVIKALKRTPRGRTAFERISEAMTSVIPTFKEVTVSTVGSYLVPRFRFEAGNQSVEFDPVQLSDGTLRIFGILLALYQIPAPALLVIEEPEQTVHPGVLGVLADAIREASETTQIIITTHSPHFVDHFSPEEIRVVTVEEGLTRVSRIKATQVEAVKQQLMSLEEFMLAEGLQPEET
jgi:predicted ATPase